MYNETDILKLHAWEQFKYGSVESMLFRHETYGITAEIVLTISGTYTLTVTHGNVEVFQTSELSAITARVLGNLVVEHIARKLAEAETNAQSFVSAEIATDAETRIMGVVNALDETIQSVLSDIAAVRELVAKLPDRKIAVENTSAFMALRERVNVLQSNFGTVKFERSDVDAARGAGERAVTAASKVALRLDGIEGAINSHAQTLTGIEAELYGKPPVRVVAQKADESALHAWEASEALRLRVAGSEARLDKVEDYIRDLDGTRQDVMDALTEHVRFEERR